MLGQRGEGTYGIITGLHRAGGYGLRWEECSSKCGNNYEEKVAVKSDCRSKCAYLTAQSNCTLAHNFVYGKKKKRKILSFLLKTNSDFSGSSFVPVVYLSPLEKQVMQ